LDELEEAARQVAHGNAAAFKRIVDATSAPLVRLGARMLGNVSDAEDVVQEAYVKAYRALVAGQFDARSSVKTWLYRIVTHSAIDASRARARQPLLTDSLEGNGDWGGLAQADARLALAELTDWLGALPPDQRAAITLKAVEGFSSAETAAILETTEGAVEQLLVRARSALRERRRGDERR
jgi:RNA polymerase sigma-70 factor (ECF subfamily)